MKIKFVPKAKPAAPPPEEDALVEHAEPAKTQTGARTNAEALHRARTDGFPGPNDKRVNCAFCGHPYYLPCRGDEHKGCMNFHAKQTRAKKQVTA